MKNYADTLIYTPGPVNVPQRVLEAGARPMIHHRSKEFSDILSGLVEKLRWLFGTNALPLLIHATGRGAMEAAVTNLFSPGDKIVSVCNGMFGEMFGKIASAHDLKVVKIAEDWQKELSAGEVEDAIARNPDARAVTVCHGDTSTARIADIPSVVAAAKKRGLLTLVDCVSTAGCIPIDFDAWGADVVVAASQKGLMSPTGLSFVFLSPDAWKAVETSAIGKCYIDFKAIKKHMSAAKMETPGSTPVSLVRSLDEALEMMREEGRENLFERHSTLAKAVRAGLETMGMKLFPADCKVRSDALSTFMPPDGLSAAAVKNGLKERFGIMIAGGLGPYADSTLRMAHMGYFFPRDALLSVAALEATLDCLAGRNAAGKGAAACIDALRP